MPDHRPQTPYVGVPKWERRGVDICSSLALFIFEIRLYMSSSEDNYFLGLSLPTINSNLLIG